jgi:hypothetical protein
VGRASIIFKKLLRAWPGLRGFRKFEFSREEFKVCRQLEEGKNQHGNAQEGQCPLGKLAANLAVQIPGDAASARPVHRSKH